MNKYWYLAPRTFFQAVRMPGAIADYERLFGSHARPGNSENPEFRSIAQTHHRFGWGAAAPQTPR